VIWLFWRLHWSSWYNFHFQTGGLYYISYCNLPSILMSGGNSELWHFVWLCPSERESNLMYYSKPLGFHVSLWKDLCWKTRTKNMSTTHKCLKCGCSLPPGNEQLVCSNCSEKQIKNGVHEIELEERKGNIFVNFVCLK
jgi:hypothetical protein